MNQSRGLITVNDAHFVCFEMAGFVLRDGLAEVRDFYDGGMVPLRPVMPMMPGHEQMADFVHSRLTALMSWLDEIALVVKTDLPQAMRVPLREDVIRGVCGRMILFGHRLVTWEDDVARHRPPAHWGRVMSLMRGMTEPLARSLFRQADGIAKLPSRARSGETYIDLSLSMPSLPQFALLADEVPRALKAGTPFYERHPILTGLFLGALLSR